MDIVHKSLDTHINNERIIVEKNKANFTAFFSYIKAGYDLYNSIRISTKELKVEDPDKIIERGSETPND